MRIFIDVGAHEGQTLEVAVDPAYDFNRIFAIEPMPAQYAILTEHYGDDPRITLCNYALTDQAGMAYLYGSNEALESSIYPYKDDVDPSITTLVETVRATTFVAALPEADIYLKLNCEGSEIPILNDLCDTGAISRITHALIDFDIRKVAGFEHLEAQTKARLAYAGLDYTEFARKSPPEQTHADRIRAWLDGVLGTPGHQHNRSV